MIPKKNCHSCCLSLQCLWLRLFLAQDSDIAQVQYLLQRQQSCRSTSEPSYENSDCLQLQDVRHRCSVEDLADGCLLFVVPDEEVDKQAKSTLASYVESTVVVYEAATRGGDVGHKALLVRATTNLLIESVCCIYLAQQVHHSTIHVSS